MNPGVAGEVATNLYSSGKESRIGEDRRSALLNSAPLRIPCSAAQDCFEEEWHAPTCTFTPPELQNWNGEWDRMHAIYSRQTSA